MGAALIESKGIEMLRRPTFGVPHALVLIAATAFALPRTAAQAVGYYEYVDPVANITGLPTVLDIGGASWKESFSTDPALPPRYDHYQAIVFGSYVSFDPRWSEFIAREKERILAFVAAGGHLVIMNQFKKLYPEELLLPPGVRAKRGGTDPKLFFVSPRESGVWKQWIGATSERWVQRSMVEVGPKDRLVFTDAFESWDRMEKSAGDNRDSRGGLGAALHAEHGQGEIHLFQLAYDKIDTAKDAKAREHCGDFFKSLLAYIRDKTASRRVATGPRTAAVVPIVPTEDQKPAEVKAPAVEPEGKGTGALGAEAPTKTAEAAPREPAKGIPPAAVEEQESTIKPPASRTLVKGRVFVDEDGDGVREPNEGALPNVLVSDGSRSTATAADGSFEFLIEAQAPPPFIVDVPPGYRLDGPWFVPPFPKQAGGNVMAIDFPLMPGGLSNTAPASLLAFGLPKLASEEDWTSFAQLVQMIVEGERPDLLLVWTESAGFDESEPGAMRAKEALATLGPPVRFVAGSAPGPGASKAFSNAFGPRRYVLSLASKRYRTVDGEIFAADSSAESRLEVAAALKREAADVVLASKGGAQAAYSLLAASGAELVLALGERSDLMIGEKLRYVAVPTLWRDGDGERAAQFLILRSDGASSVVVEVVVPEAAEAVVAESRPDSQPTGGGAPDRGDVVSERPEAPAIAIQETIDSHPLVRGSLAAAVRAALGTPAK